jgi:hypothetical protein
MCRDNNKKLGRRRRRRRLSRKEKEKLATVFVTRLEYVGCNGNLPSKQEDIVSLVVCM